MKGMKEGRYKAGHDGRKEDTAWVQKFLEDSKDSLEHLIVSLDNEIFEKIKNGPLPRELLVRDPRPRRGNRQRR